MDLSLSNFSAAELSLKKLQHLELMEDIVDLAKKVAVSGRKRGSSAPIQKNMDIHMVSGLSCQFITVSR